MIKIQNDNLDQLMTKLETARSQIMLASQPHYNYKHTQRPDVELTFKTRPRKVAKARNLDEVRQEVASIFQSVIMERQIGLSLKILEYQSRYLKEKIKHLEDLATSYLQYQQIPLNFAITLDFKRLSRQVQKLAAKHNYALLFEDSAHLYRVPSSLTLIQGKATLVIHIPIAREDSLMLLFSFHPFPLPLDNEVSLVPNAGNEILAVSTSTPNLRMWEISAGDLRFCHREGTLYICSRRDLGYKHLDNTSCQAAFFQKKFDLAMDVCGFHVQFNKEVFHSLPDNWYLTYQPKKETLNVTCFQSGDTFSIDLLPGVSKFQLEPGCEAESSRYRMISSIGLFSKNQIQLDMDWSPGDFLTEDMIATCHKWLKKGLLRIPVKLPTKDEL